MSALEEKDCRSWRRIASCWRIACRRDSFPGKVVGTASGVFSLCGLRVVDLLLRDYQRKQQNKPTLYQSASSDHIIPILRHISGCLLLSIIVACVEVVHDDGCSTSSIAANRVCEPAPDVAQCLRDCVAISATDVAEFLYSNILARHERIIAITLSIFQCG